MAQSGFTPIQLYRTATASATPSAGNLADGELAINTNDGRLFYKDSGGVVRTIASSASTSGVFTPGTVSAPGITFTGDTNTGIYSPAADTIAFTEGGVESMRIDASGNVGIGTNAPGTKLDIYDPAGAGNPAVRIRDNVSDLRLYPSGGGSYVATISNTPLILNTNNTERMRVTETGNVGIGTSSPASKLSVSNASSVQMQATTGTIDYRVQCIDASSISYSGTVSSHAFGFTTNNAERMRIDASGNVGIGTSSPGNRLEVLSAGGTSQFRVRNDAVTPTAYYDFGRDGTDGFFGFSGAQTTFSGYKWSVNAGTEVMRITNAGNVGIGTASPGVMLDVSGSIRASQSITIGNGGGTYQAGSIYSDANWGMLIRAAQASPVIAQFAFVDSTGGERLRVGPAGQIGIGGANYGTSGQVLTSNGAGSAPSWQNSGGGFPSGTAMLFVQTSAPTGWTKSTAHNDKALRVVSGAASSGGSVAFTTAFASQAVNGTVGSTTLTTTQIPSHNHTTAITRSGFYGGSSDALQTLRENGGTTSFTSNSTGGGGSHNHSFTGTAINLAVQYVDAIIATKD